MFIQRLRSMHQKTVLTALVLTIMIYGFSQIYKSDTWQPYLLQGGFAAHSDKQHPIDPDLMYEVELCNMQQLNLSSGEVKQSDKKKVSIPPEEDKQNQKGLVSGNRQCKTKQPSLPPPAGEEHSDEKQQYLPQAITNNTVEIVQHLVNLVGNLSKFSSYVKNLTSSQVKDIVRHIGVSNLTSRISQEQFLECPGMALLKQLKGKQPNSSIHMPLSFQHCKNMSFKNFGPRVVLASVPGSGNSWVRQLLESATGIYTGALFCDQAYLKVGMIGEGVRTENVLVIKSHSLPHPERFCEQYDKAIYIVRSPFRAILAEHNRGVAYFSKHYKDAHTAEVRFNYVNNSRWNNRVKKSSQRWKAQVTQWLNAKGFPKLIIGYENLRRDPYTELKKMLDFIGYPYSEDDVLCAIKSHDESFHRKHTKEIHAYSLELQKFINDKIKQVNSDLLKHNISLL